MLVIKANKRLGVVTTPAERKSILPWIFFPSVSGRFFLQASLVPKSLQGCSLIVYKYSIPDVVTVSNVCVWECVCVCFGWICEHTALAISCHKDKNLTRKSLTCEL